MAMHGFKKMKEYYGLSNDDEHSQIFTDPPSYENLPERIIKKVFGYLNPFEMRRAGRSCKRWYDVLKNSTYWRRIDTFNLGVNYINIFPFLKHLPSYITHLRIYCNGVSSNGISFSDLCMVLYERCPHLEQLYIENCMLNGTTTNYYVDDYIICGPTKNLIFQKDVLKEYRARRELLFLPKSLRLLSFRNSMFEDDLLLFSITSADHFSNIEVLDFTETWVHEQARGKYVFLKYDELRELYLPHCKFLKNGMKSLAKVLPHLQILNLSYATVRKFDLNSLQCFGDNLVEMYFCGIPIHDDDDLTCLHKGVFPKVKVMCFQGSVVKQQIAKRLFDCCRVLEIVYAIFPADDSGDIRIGYYERRPGNISFLHADNVCKMHSSKVKYHINAA